MTKTAIKNTSAVALHETVGKAPSRSDIRVHKTAEVGDWAHQGDIYVTMLPKNFDLSKYVLTHETQLAPGTTKGSRHMAVGKVKVYVDPKNTNPLQGPVVVAEERWLLDHPEHAGHEMPEGCWNVTYQRDFATEELRRVRD